MRKVEANRRNALKSTGPRTPKGKEYTGRNAVKHGLLASHISDFRALDEDPQEFEDLLNGLWDSLQPVGRAEEEEVENMALCRWKQKRAWRYENAVNLVARRKLDTEKLPLQIAYCQKQGQEEAAVILLLQGMQKEIEDAGQISQALKQQIFALMPGLEGIWLAFDKDAQERAKVLDAPEKFENLSSQTRSLIVASATVTNLIAFVENLSKRRWSDLKEVTIGLEAIPGGVPLDCLLRYGAGNDRSFDRSLHRFERLRRLRREERIPRSKSLRWTQ
jgi:hypothetical protein